VQKVERLGTTGFSRAELSSFTSAKQFTELLKDPSSLSTTIISPRFPF
jgi:hypothetical protein